MSLVRPTYKRPNEALHPNRSVTREAHESRQQQQNGRDYDELLALKGLHSAKLGALRNPNAPRGMGVFF